MVAVILIAPIAAAATFTRVVNLKSQPSLRDEVYQAVGVDVAAAVPERSDGGQPVQCLRVSPGVIASRAGECARRTRGSANRSEEIRDKIGNRAACEADLLRAKKPRSAAESYFRAAHHRCGPVAGNGVYGQ
jgi:hypothetical protein